MPAPTTTVNFEVLESILNEKLLNTNSPRKVAQVALYLLTYIFDRTGVGIIMDRDPLFTLVRSKLRILAFAGQEGEHAELGSEPITPQQGNKDETD